jgi:hypothetical protein
MSKREFRRKMKAHSWFHLAWIGTRYYGMTLDMDITVVSETRKKANNATLPEQESTSQWFKYG